MERKKTYVSDNAQLMEEWNWEKNQQLEYDPHKLSMGSGRKAWWICSNGHEWGAVIASRTRGSGCPYCSGRFAITGVNDFETVYPNIAAEWDYEKNNDLPSQTTCHSHKKVWWVCPNGHNYQATVQHRSYGDNCPYCSGQKVLAGYNDLESSYPQLASEWNYERNAPLLPSEVTSRSGLKVWWKCDKGHEWQAAVYSRQNGNGCPVCSNKAVQAGFNDLATVNPELANEWNYTKNGSLLPTMVTTNSGKKVWWVCSRGHEWESSVDHRTRGRGCPICLTDQRSSFPEQAIFYYVSQKYACALNRYKLNQRYELDIFVPELNVAIEYDGVYFHASEKSVGREKNKNAACYREKILLIRVKEDTKATSVLIQQWNPFLIKIIFNPQKDYNNLQQVLDELFRILKRYDDTLDLSVNLENDRTEILSLLKQSDVADNLEEKCPEIAAEWNYFRNGLLRPDSFAWASNQSVWWICPQGHEYQAKISNRTVLNRNCPICAVQKRSKSKHQRSVEKHNFQDWCYEHGMEQNAPLTPWDVAAYDNRDYHWICEEGHSFVASPANRNNGTECPYCQHKKPIVGENDLATLYPRICRQWHPTKNGGKQPSDYLPQSHEMIHWQCEAGHEWEIEIYQRVNGNECPYCENRLPIAGETDLGTLHPELSKRWHPNKNGVKKPSDYLPNSGEEVWWQCEKGHEWEKEIGLMVKGAKCPYCEGRLPVVGETDLGTLHPELSKRWHPNKNGAKKPSNYLPNSGEEVWWQCEKGHEWKKEIALMVKGGKCPYCEGKLPVIGETDLATLHPELCRRWHPTRNRKSPDQYFPDSSVRTAWQCEFGHSFRAPIREMVNRWRCPKCERNRKRR